MTRHDDRGSATVLVLAVVAVLTSLAIAGAAVGGVLVGQRRAASAADLAALAAAESLGSGGGTAVGREAACGLARTISDENGARLTGCLVEGAEVVVEVGVDVPSILGGSWSVPARARAGPVAGASGSGGPGP